MADPAGIISLVAGTVLLAKSVYVKCRDCPGKYEDLKSETRQLVNILEDLEALAQQHELNDSRRHEFYDRADTCGKVLHELERELDTYKSLGFSTRRLPDRVRWDESRVKELRDRLMASVTMLNTFYQRLFMSSQTKIEKALMQLIEEIQNGHRPPTTLSGLPAVANEAADEMAWPDILGELEDIGVPREASEEHRPYIVTWLRDAKPDIQSAPTSEAGNSSSNSNNRMSNQQLGSGSSATSYKHHPPLKTHPDGLRYMEPFGEYGENAEAEVRRSANTFKEDLNRSREYWVRSNWAEAKANLVRVLVASQLPHHRRHDIDARTTAFLLGVACSNSGDFEKAKQIFFTILEPFPRSGSPDDVPPINDGQIAAATWLGDVCLKTNKTEDAALAWCIALDAVRRRDQEIARMRNRNNSVHMPQASSPMTPPSSPPARSQFSIRHPSMELPQQTYAGGGNVAGPSAQARIILSEIVLVNRGTGNLHSLREGVESGWYPDMADATGSIFAESQLMSSEQMQMIVINALAACEQADDRTAFMSSYKTQSGDAISQMVLCKRQNIIRSSSGRTRVEEMITPDEVLRSPTRRGAWPTPYDVEFSYLAAITALEYIHEHTSLKEEGVSFNIPILDVKDSKQLVAEKGEPIYIADDLKPKERKHVERFIEAVRNTLSLMDLNVREAPAEFRCQPRTDFPHPRWASVASLSVRVIGYEKTNKLGMGKPKLACYVSDIVHWDGRHDAQDTSDKGRSELVQQIYYSLAIRHQNERGMYMVGAGPRGSGPDAVSMTL